MLDVRMKKAIKLFGISSITILIASIIVDLHVFRGYFSLPYLYPQTYEEYDGDIEYRIDINQNGTLNLSFKNNSPTYVPVILYRWAVMFDLTDTMLFHYAGRHRFLKDEHVIFDSGGGFDCGTDLYAALIKPYESFSLKHQNLEQFLSTSELGHFIVSIKEQGIDISPSETVTCQLYLPIFSFGAEKTRIYSNKFEIPTKYVLEEYESYIEEWPSFKPKKNTSNNR